MVTKQWRNRHLATAFHGWVASVEHRVQLRCKAAMVVTALRSRLMRSAFNTWAAYAHYKSELAGKVSGSISLSGILIASAHGLGLCAAFSIACFAAVTM